MRAAALLCSACAALSAFAQHGPCTASGSVTREGDGAPVARARVFFRGGDRAHPLVLGFFTADDGTFRAFGLDPASYNVTAQKSGLLSTGQGGSRADLARNCRLTGIALKLSPASVLAGHLSSPQGLPAAGARVEAQKRLWFGGRWQYRTVATSTSDAFGDFRIASLPAGDYVVRAHPSGPLTVSFRNPSGPDNYISPSYYPGVLSSAQARTVGVEAGAEIAGLDFPLVLTPLLRVSGRIASGEGLKAPAWCAVTLRSRSTGVVYDARYQASSGTFVFPEVAPGEYELMAYSAETANIGSASRLVEVDSADVEGLDIQLDPPFRVQGRAILQGGTLPSNGVWVRLRPLFPQAAQEGAVAVGDDGTFEFAAIQHGRYQLSILSDQPNIYLKSILFDGKALPGTVLDWTSDAPRRFSLILGNDGGRVQGSATGLGPGAQSLAYAVLVPADMSRLAGTALLTAQVSLDGSFRITSVPPGDYLAYAFSMPPGAGFDARDMLEDPGWVPTCKTPPVRLRVEPGGAAGIQVRSAPLP